MSPFIYKAALFAVLSGLALQVSAQSGGEALFNAHCAKCHGKDGAGKTAVAARLHIPDLGSHAVQALTDAEIFDSIARGARHKEYPHAFEFRGMSKSDIGSLVTYIRSMARK